jgi:myo-inositol-1-phosphate synthase
VRTAVVGVGNCACTLLQALESIQDDELKHPDLVPALAEVDPVKMEIVAAFDVDERKVGRPLDEAVKAAPNCTTIYRPLRPSPVAVQGGPPLDGTEGLQHVVRLATGLDTISVDHVARRLTDAQADTVLLYLPVGSQAACDFYTEAALRADCSLINCTPAMVANSPTWQRRFAARNLVLLGDDMKSLVGSTTIHQALLTLLAERGLEVTSSYQLNIGGNTDFLNMRDPGRAAAKRATKVGALHGLLPAGSELGVGPSDHVPQLKDRKVGYIRVEATGYLGMPFSLELRLEVEDSPNAAPVAIEAIRLVEAIRTGIPVDVASACARLFKAPRDRVLPAPRRPERSGRG